MLNREQLKRYRELRGLSTRQVAEHCDISQAMIVYVETGARNLTQYCHDQIVNGINEAADAIRRKEAEKEDAAVQENTDAKPIDQGPTRADAPSDGEKNDTCKKRPSKRKKIPKQADDAG